MKFLFISIAFFFSSFSADDITGKWTVVESSTQNVTGVEFKEDGTYQCYMGNVLVVDGMYTYNKKDSILSIHDDGCLTKVGTYKVKFIGNNSLWFIPIEDNCASRRESIQSTLLSRIIIK